MKIVVGKIMAILVRSRCVKPDGKYKPYADEQHPDIIMYLQHAKVTSCVLFTSHQWTSNGTETEVHITSVMHLPQSRHTQGDWRIITISFVIYNLILMEIQSATIRFMTMRSLQVIVEPSAKFCKDHLSEFCHVSQGPESYIPDCKVHGATWGPSGSTKTQVGPMLAPWTLLPGYLLDIMIVYTKQLTRQYIYHDGVFHCVCVLCEDVTIAHFGIKQVFYR